MTEKTVEELLKEALSGNTFSQKANNPMTWVYFVGALIVMVFSMGVFIYNSDKELFIKELNNSSALALANRESVINTNTSLQQISATQRMISDNMSRISTEVGENSEDIRGIRQSRFTPDNMKPYEMRVSLNEKTLTQIANKISEIYEKLAFKEQALYSLKKSVDQLNIFMYKTENTFNNLQTRQD